MTHRITVPAQFWYDHADRGCTPALSETPRGRRIELLLSEEALADLESDAWYYSDARHFEPDLQPLCRSAQRTSEIIAQYRRSISPD